MVTTESSAIYLKPCDTIKGAFDPLAFKRMVDLAQDNQAQEIRQPSAAVENVAKAAILPDGAKNALTIPHPRTVRQPFLFLCLHTLET